jgi:hypothetical protein
MTAISFAPSKAGELTGWSPLSIAGGSEDGRVHLDRGLVLPAS